MTDTHTLEEEMMFNDFRNAPVRAIRLIGSNVVFLPSLLYLLSFPLTATLAADEWSQRTFERVNLRLSFPGPLPAKPSSEAGNDTTEGFSLEIDDATRLTFGGMQAATRDALFGTIIESSPIVWHGCPGSEWTLLYQKRNVEVMYVYRRKDVRVGDRMVILEHKVLLPDREQGLHAIRHFHRAETERFFGSLEPINPIDPQHQTATQQRPELEGRWITIQEKGKRPTDPIEMGFLKVKSQSQFSMGKFRLWGQPDSGVATLGSYSIDSSKRNSGSLEIFLDPKTLYALYELNGSELTIQLSETRLTNLDPAQGYVLRRPGDTNDPQRPDSQPAAVTEVDWSETPLTDAELKTKLARYPDLTKLNIWDTKVTDAGLAELVKLKQLKLLAMGNTAVTGVGLKDLADLPKLDTLVLSGSPVDDAGLKAVGGLAQLQLLHLCKTKVTDAGLVQLKSLKKLEHLNLRETAITDAGLAALAELKQLKGVNLIKTKCTRDGVDQLKKLLPGCYISF